MSNDEKSRTEQNGASSSESSSGPSLALLYSLIALALAAAIGVAALIVLPFYRRR